MISFSQLLSGLGAVLLTMGSLLTLISALGVLRFPTLLQRQHAATKPQLLGFILFCFSVALIRQSLAWLAVVSLAILLQTLTAPIGAHLIGRTARQLGEINDLAEPVHYRDFEHLPRPYDQRLRVNPKTEQASETPTAS